MLPFRDFKILGTADRDAVQTNQSQCLIGDIVSGLRVENMTFEGLRFMVTAFSYVTDGTFIGNRLINCMRDGLRCVNSYNITIKGNHFKNVSDDAVALHTLDSATVLGSGYIVTENTFEACQGVKILGAKNFTVSRNTFKRMIRTPIDIRVPFTGGTEGNTALFDGDVSDNIIQDTFGSFGTINGILISSYAYEDDGLTPDQPGVNAPPCDYNWVNNIDTGGEVHVGAHRISVKNNKISRTLAAVADYSDYGFGQLYDVSNGWPHNPAIGDSDFVCHGISASGAISGLEISGNQISGLGEGLTAIRLTSSLATDYPDFIDTLIESNIIRDCPGTGVSIIGGDTTAGRSPIIRNNIFDLDPYFRAATHNSDNTWSSATSVKGISSNSDIEGFIATGNKFAHCAVPISTISGVGYVNDNFVVCDPASIADNASNKGVRALTAEHGFIHVKYNGDPTSSTFGRITSMPLAKASSIPTSGWYAAGHFVWAAGLAPAADGSLLLGWLRLTTGTGHVSGTDWLVVSIPYFSQASVLLGVGKIPTTAKALLYVDNANTTTPIFTIEQDGSGDATQQFLLTGSTAWAIGVDNTDDAFKIDDSIDGYATPLLTIAKTTGHTTVTGSLVVSGQAVTGAGALTLGKTYHSLSNSSGSTYAVTLAAPTSAENGVVKTIEMIAGDGTNTVTLALTNVVGGSASTTATFDAAGETLVLVARSAKWVVLDELGVTLT